MVWQDALVGTLMAALLAWFLTLAQRPPQLQAGAVVLRYPRPMRLFLTGGALFFAAGVLVACWPLLAGSATPKDLRQALVVVPLFGLFLVGCAAEPRVLLRLDLDGIGGRTAFRGRQHLAWADLVQVRWSRTNQWFVLQDRDGRKLRVSRLLAGHEAVPAMLRDRVPEPVWADAVAQWEAARQNRPQ